MSLYSEFKTVSGVIKVTSHHHNDLFYTHTSLVRTLRSVLLVFMLERFDCSNCAQHCVHSLRHVILPKELAELVPRTHLMTESEWRNLGVQQSPGWIHYLIHAPGKE